MSSEPNFSNSDTNATFRASRSPGMTRRSNYIGVDALSGACIPMSGRTFEFRAGYRTHPYTHPDDDEDGEQSLVELEAAAPANILCQVFLECLMLLADTVGVVVEYIHAYPLRTWTSSDPTPCDFFLREEIDRSMLIQILRSHLRWLLLDGKCGIAVFNSESAGYNDATEVRLNDDKIVRINSDDVRPYGAVLESRDIRLAPRIELVSDAGHIHHSSGKLESDAKRVIAELNAVPAFRD